MSNSPVLRNSPNKVNVDVHFDKDQKLPLKSNNKRVAQSPMTPSLAQSNSRRRIYTKKNLSYDSELWQIAFDGWMLQKQMERNQQIQEFRELELELQLEFGKV